MRLSDALDEIAKFQFHKVRLKVGGKLALCAPESFQFHKVRLKEVVSNSATADEPCFNSIRYD